MSKVAWSEEQERGITIVDVGTRGHVDWGFTAQEVDGSVSSLLNKAFGVKVDEYRKLWNDALEREVLAAIGHVYPEMEINKLTELKYVPTLCKRFQQQQYPDSWEFLYMDQVMVTVTRKAINLEIRRYYES